MPRAEARGHKSGIRLATVGAGHHGAANQRCGSQHASEGTVANPSGRFPAQGGGPGDTDSETIARLP